MTDDHGAVDRECSRCEIANACRAGHWPYGAPERFASPSQIRSISLAPQHFGEDEKRQAEARRVEKGAQKEERSGGKQEQGGEGRKKKPAEVGGIGVQLTETGEGGFVIEGMTPNGPAAQANKVQTSPILFRPPCSTEPRLRYTGQRWSVLRLTVIFRLA